MKVIGITGGVGSGKSEVLKFLEQEYGAVVCQMDEVAKQCYRILRSVRISSVRISSCASHAKVRAGARSVERPTPVLSASSSLLNFER